MSETIRCFVGLPLPEDWQAALDRVVERLARRLASRISWTRPGNWHLTLKFLGEVEVARLSEISAALSGVCFAPFALRLCAAGQFGHGGPPKDAPKALWAGLTEGAEAAASLAAQVDRALAACGFALESRPFRAHVTLGRVKAAAGGDAGGDNWGVVAEELGREAFGVARAERFVLWRSILGPQGPKYAALYGFPAVLPATTAGG